MRKPPSPACAPRSARSPLVLESRTAGPAPPCNSLCPAAATVGGRPPRPEVPAGPAPTFLVASVDFGDRPAWTLTPDLNVPNRYLVDVVLPRGPKGDKGDTPDIDDLDLTALTLDWARITNKPILFSGAYADLTGKPALFSGAYGDLAGKPSLGTAAALNGGTAPGNVVVLDGAGKILASICRRWRSRTSSRLVRRLPCWRSLPSVRHRDPDRSQQDLCARGRARLDARQLERAAHAHRHGPVGGGPHRHDHQGSAQDRAGDRGADIADATAAGRGVLTAASYAARLRRCSRPSSRTTVRWRARRARTGLGRGRCRGRQVSSSARGRAPGPRSRPACSQTASGRSAPRPRSRRPTTASSSWSRPRRGPRSPLTPTRRPPRRKFSCGVRRADGVIASVSIAAAAGETIGRARLDPGASGGLRGPLQSAAGATRTMFRQRGGWISVGRASLTGVSIATLTVSEGFNDPEMDQAEFTFSNLLASAGGQMIALRGQNRAFVSNGYEVRRSNQTMTRSTPTATLFV